MPKKQEGDRLKELIEYLNTLFGTDRQLVEIFEEDGLNVGNTSIYSWKSRVHKPTEESLSLLAEFLGVEVEELQGYLSGKASLKTLLHKGDFLEETFGLRRNQLVVRLAQLSAKELTWIQSDLIVIQEQLNTAMTRLLAGSTLESLQRLLTQKIAHHGLAECAKKSGLSERRIEELLDPSSEKPNVMEIFGLATLFGMDAGELEEAIAEQYD